MKPPTSSIIKGYRTLSCGKCSDTFIDAFRIIQNPRLAAPTYEKMAKKAMKFDPQIVIGPLTGGAIIAENVARITQSYCGIAEKVNGTWRLRGEFHHNYFKSARILLVDDVFTTGSTFRALCNDLNIIDNDLAFMAMIYRFDKDFDPFFQHIYKIKAPIWEPDDCTVCKGKKKLCQQEEN